MKRKCVNLYTYHDLDEEAKSKAADGFYQTAVAKLHGEVSEVVSGVLRETEFTAVGLQVDHEEEVVIVRPIIYKTEDATTYAGLRVKFEQTEFYAVNVSVEINTTDNEKVAKLSSVCDQIAKAIIRFIGWGVNPMERKLTEYLDNAGEVFLRDGTYAGKILEVLEE